MWGGFCGALDAGYLVPEEQVPPKIEGPARTGGSNPVYFSKFSKEKQYTKEFTKFIIEQEDDLLLLLTMAL